MRIYLAAPWAEKDGLAKEAKRLVESAGHEVVSSWIDREVGEPPYSDQFMSDEAKDDYHELAYLTDAVILLNTQPRGQETSGKAVETGIALAFELPVVLVGERTNVFHWLPSVTVVSTVEEALDVLANRR